MLKLTHEILKGFDSSIEVEFLFSLMKKMFLHPDLFFNGSIVDEKKYTQFTEMIKSRDRYRNVHIKNYMPELAREVYK